MFMAGNWRFVVGRHRLDFFAMGIVAPGRRILAGILYAL